MPKLEEVLGALIVAKVGQFTIHEDGASIETLFRILNKNTFCVENLFGTIFNKSMKGLEAKHGRSSSSWLVESRESPSSNRPDQIRFRVFLDRTLGCVNATMIWRRDIMQQMYHHRPSSSTDKR